MMKKIFLIVIFIGFNVKGLCQFAYYDALKLRTIVTEENEFNASDDNIDMVTNILSRYVTLADGESYTYSNMVKVIGTSLNSKNPFLASYMFHSGSNDRVVSVSKGLFSSMESIPVTNFADGLAKFLIKRSKQELVVSFFEKLPELQRKYPEFRILFPHTTILINNFESWEYANIINTLREAFDKDLKEILINLPNITAINTSSIDACECTEAACKRISSYQQFLSSEKGIAISGSFLIAAQFLSGNKLPVIINNVATNEGLGKIHLNNIEKENNIKGTLAFMRIISNALRSNDINKSYVSIEEIKKLFKDNVSRDIFFGLIYQQLSDEKVTINGQLITTFLNPNKIEGASNYILNFIESATSIDNAIQNLKEKRKQPDTDLAEHWATIFQSVNDFLPVLSNVEIIDASFRLPKGIQAVVSKSQFATTIAHDIAVKNYSAAIVGILKELSVDDSNNEFKEFKTFFLKYGSFAANIVQAKDSDEVEKAIEAVVLPVGSASIKKKVSFNIALNAYLGGFYGNEYLRDKSSNQWGIISGIYTPVGITFSKPINNRGSGNKFLDCISKGASLSALVNIIDIGAITSFRLQDATSKDLPEIKFENILAPGIGIIYGFPGLPLSVGYSYQLGPLLREISTENVTNTSQINRRWQFFIGVDIPLFNFYTKSN